MIRVFNSTFRVTMLYQNFTFSICQSSSPIHLANNCLFSTDPDRNRNIAELSLLSIYNCISAMSNSTPSASFSI